MRHVSKVRFTPKQSGRHIVTATKKNLSKSVDAIGEQEYTEDRPKRKEMLT